MKIKSDFVTNSSSASFVVIGTHLNPSKITTFKRGDQPEDIWEVIEPLVKGTDLEWSQGCEYSDGEDVMVGIGYMKMKDDETLGQFKDRSKKQIKDAFGIETDVGHIEECWMDN